MKIKLIAIIFIIIFGTLFLFRNEIINLYYGISRQLPIIEETASGLLVESLSKEVVAPPPLRSPKEDPNSFLTKTGVIQWTNSQRLSAGLPTLSESAKLNMAAENKLEDMFENQYFAHVSPSGFGAGYFAEVAGYEFIVIGENLALGDFKNDQGLVQAWMDSPDHRANILSPNYQDIGVAVGKDEFEGSPRWLAVQVFGKSLSVCPQPEESLKVKIEIYENQISELKNRIDSLIKEIQNMRPKKGSLYNDKVAEYNELVSQYNVLIDESKILIQEYNQQVRLFNTCAKN